MMVKKLRGLCLNEVQSKCIDKGGEVERGLLVDTCMVS